MASICLVDDVHLFHHLLVAQIREPLANHGIVQGNVSQPTTAIQPGKSLDLPTAKLAVTVIDNNIGIGALSRVG